MLGPIELVVIAFILLLLFGSKKLPDLARSLGNFMNEFEKGKGGAKPAKKPDSSKKAKKTKKK